MPLPTIAGVHRVVLNWEDANSVGRACNVMHVQTAGSTQNIADAFWGNFTDEMWRCVVATGQILSIDVTKLDGSPDGENFERPPGTEANGSGGGVSIPQACGLLKLTTSGGGRSGRGRLYFPWLSESEQADGNINADVVEAVTEAWMTFSNALIALTCPLVIASYTHNTSRVVTNVRLEDRIATQRRRLRR